MAPIEAVIFDLGRVMLSIDPFRPKFSALMLAMGIRPEEAFGVYWREPEVIAHMTGRMTPERFHQSLRARFGLRLAYADFVEAWSDLFAPIAGMEDIFENVGKRFRVGILSDTDSLHWRKALALLPRLRRAARPTLSFEVGFLKPAPETYREAARNADAPPGACLFIDDLPENVEGARNAGMAGIVFAGAERLRGELEVRGIL
ncbi:MAG: HAD family phosphatase [Planctomycetota bacterium]|jgi:putative hydrolase of the HAD superfamily|nr:HAD family phosphatase [Planctomycetota bacterium]